MKARTLQIVWHGKQPVCTLDFFPGAPNVLATGGADKEINLWEVNLDEKGTPGVAYLGSFGGLTSSVNIVRFSPLGGDGGEVLVWKPIEAGASRQTAIGDSDEKRATWRTHATLRGHAGDVLDLAWAPDGSALLSGGVENLGLLWDVEAKRSVARLEGHQHYVQGVAWDPLGWSCVTLSNDRTARVHGVKAAALHKKSAAAAGQPPSSAGLLKDFSLVSSLSRRVMADVNDADAAAAAPKAAPAGAVVPSVCPGTMPAPPARHPLFQDETLHTFFRRPAWAPDGSFVVLPAGVFKADPGSPACPTTYVFSRGEWAAPLAQLPALGHPTVAARFSPVLYRLRAKENGAGTPDGHPWQSLPYRMVWAVATLASVLIYNSQSLEPLALLGGLHMAAITDLAWSPDGRVLAVSSMDGYCSLAVFEDGELGDPVPPEELPPGAAAAATHAAAARHAERSARKQSAETTKLGAEGVAQPSSMTTPSRGSPAKTQSPQQPDLPSVRRLPEQALTLRSPCRATPSSHGAQLNRGRVPETAGTPRATAQPEVIIVLDGDDASEGAAAVDMQATPTVARRPSSGGAGALLAPTATEPPAARTPAAAVAGQPAPTPTPGAAARKRITPVPVAPRGDVPPLPPTTVAPTAQTAVAPSKPVAAASGPGPSPAVPVAAAATAPAARPVKRITPVPVLPSACTAASTATATATATPAAEAPGPVAAPAPAIRRITPQLVAPVASRAPAIAAPSAVIAVREGLAPAPHHHTPSDDAGSESIHTIDDDESEEDEEGEEGSEEEEEEGEDATAGSLEVVGDVINGADEPSEAATDAEMEGTAEGESEDANESEGDGVEGDRQSMGLKRPAAHTDDVLPVAVHSTPGPAGMSFAALAALAGQRAAGVQGGELLGPAAKRARSNDES